MQLTLLTESTQQIQYVDTLERLQHQIEQRKMQIERPSFNGDINVAQLSEEEVNRINKPFWDSILSRPSVISNKKSILNQPPPADIKSQPWSQTPNLDQQNSSFLKDSIMYNDGSEFESGEESDALVGMTADQKDLLLSKASNRQKSNSILVMLNSNLRNNKNCKYENELVDKASFNTADFESINFTSSSTNQQDQSNHQQKEDLSKSKSINKVVKGMGLVCLMLIVPVTQ